MSKNLNLMAGSEAIIWINRLLKRSSTNLVINSVLCLLNKRKLHYKKQNVKYKWDNLEYFCVVHLNMTAGWPAAFQLLYFWLQSDFIPVLFLSQCGKLLTGFLLLLHVVLQPDISTAHLYTKRRFHLSSAFYYCHHFKTDVTKTQT